MAILVSLTEADNASDRSANLAALDDALIALEKLDERKTGWWNCASSAGLFRELRRSS